MFPLAVILLNAASSSSLGPCFSFPRFIMQTQMLFSCTPPGSGLDAVHSAEASRCGASHGGSRPAFLHPKSTTLFRWPERPVGGAMPRKVGPLTTGRLCHLLSVGEWTLEARGPIKLKLLQSAGQVTRQHRQRQDLCRSFHVGALHNHPTILLPFL